MSMVLRNLVHLFQRVNFTTVMTKNTSTEAEIIGWKNEFIVADFMSCHGTALMKYMKAAKQMG